MRIRTALVALVGLALFAPEAAEARGGGSRGGGGGGRGGSPGVSRTSAPRSSAPRASAPRSSAPRSSAPRASAPRSSGHRTSAPRSYAPRAQQAPRVRAPRVEAPRARSAPRATTSRVQTARAPRIQPRASGDGLVRDAGRRLNAPSSRSGGAPGFRASPGTTKASPDLTRGQGVPRGGQAGRADSARERPGVFGTGRGGDAAGTGTADRNRGSGLLGDVSRRLGNDGFSRGDSIKPAGQRPKDWGEFRDGFRNGHRTRKADSTQSSTTHHDGHHDGHHDHGCHGYHDWYDHHGWYLSFSFGIGWGPYYGVSYYWPYHSYVYGCDYAFFYPYPVSYAYVPYGFYFDSTPIYVTRYEVIRETVPAVEYGTNEVLTEEEAEAAPAGPAAPAEQGEVKVADPRPAAGSPATEKFLREASVHFREKNYYEAAVQFRLAALSSPELPGPLFALGQSLMAMGQDAYAARVIRRAVQMDARILQETGDISGVFASTAEYERVIAELEARAKDAPVDGDARFLLAAERYFAGDARCREEFDRFHVARPEDEAVNLFRSAVGSRFKAPEDLDLPVPEKPK